MRVVMVTTHPIQHQVPWLRLTEPSIPQAMNVGLQEARSDVVLSSRPNAS
ncbi:hypothetical protein [Thermomonas sp.]|nr:hypothetical protein [Thermomonas sp.]